MDKNLAGKSASQMKDMVMKAMALEDRATIARITAEVKRRAEAHKAQGTGSQALYNAVAKMK